MILAGFIPNIKPQPVTPMDETEKAAVGGVMAVICGILGFILLWRYFREGLCCKTAVEAEIMQIDKSTVKKGGQSVSVYAPVYSYHYNGTHYTHDSNVYTADAFEIGQKVTVYIDPNDPAHCRDKRRRNKSALIWGIIFLVLAAVGVLLL